MSIFYENTYPVDSRDTDLFGQCSPSALLGFLAECLPGEEISLYTGQKEGEHDVLGRGREGKERFHAILTLDKLAPED